MNRLLYCVMCHCMHECETNVTGSLNHQQIRDVFAHAVLISPGYISCRENPKDPAKPLTMSRGTSLGGSSSSPSPTETQQALAPRSRRYAGS